MGSSQLPDTIALSPASSMPDASNRWPIGIVPKAFQHPAWLAVVLGSDKLYKYLFGCCVVPPAWWLATDQLNRMVQAPVGPT